MAKSKEIDNPQPHGRFQKFVFIVLIPILFIIVVTLVVLTATGTNVFEKAQSLGIHLPFTNDKEPASADTEKEDTDALKVVIEDQKAEIAQLNSSLEQKTKEADGLNASLEQQASEMEELRQTDEESKRSFKEIISTYEAMSAKNAAPVILNLKDDDAVRILSSVKPATLASILEKMPPADAAKYTALITAEEGGSQ
ncbi:MotE family protein [Rossellomorea marisflavi]|uniref:MotE family protein n=1 Tax=Rossellomorea marisflavi TaxID=189381 RepID=UPI003459F0EF